MTPRAQKLCIHRNKDYPQEVLIGLHIISIYCHDSVLMQKGVWHLCSEVERKGVEKAWSLSAFGFSRKNMFPELDMKFRVLSILYKCNIMDAVCKILNVNDISYKSKSGKDVFNPIVKQTVALITRCKQQGRNNTVLYLHSFFKGLIFFFFWLVEHWSKS